MQVDERYYNNYVENDPLDSQIELLNKLEAMGWEKDEDRILTTQNFGIPTTSILLLMKEAADEIEKIQTEICEKCENERIKENDLIKNHTIKIPHEEMKGNRFWKGKSSCKLDEQSTVSGSGGFTFAQVIIPEGNNKLPLDSYISSDSPKVFVGKDYIKVSEDKIVPLIKVYKATFQFHEFSYVLCERIKGKEIAAFCKNAKIELPVPLMGKTFKGNIGRRIQIVHHSYFGFSIGDDLTIRISKRKLTEITRKGLNEAICWVDSVYKSMLDIVKSRDGV